MTYIHILHQEYREFRGDYQGDDLYRGPRNQTPYPGCPTEHAGFRQGGCRVYYRYSDIRVSASVTGAYISPREVHIFKSCSNNC